jgi:hypothetical protein
MRGTLLTGGLLLLAALSDASGGELFRKGPVQCGAGSPDISAMQVAGCQWSKAPGGGYYTGTCQGSVARGNETVRFSVSGEAKRVDYVYPDNDTPLTFSYAGLTCAVHSPRLKTVKDCRSFDGGLGKECLVCAVTAAKVCFKVRIAVRLNDGQTVAASQQP